MSLTVFPLSSPRKTTPFDLFAALRQALKENDSTIMAGDIIIVSTKYAAISQGRTLPVSEIRVSSAGRHLAQKYAMNPSVAETVLRESDSIMGGMAGFVLASAHDMVAPNAGIDASNAGIGKIVLYPTNPNDTAEKLHRQIRLFEGIHAGVILSDSRLMPGRVGTVGVAVACAGIDPILDMRGEMDLDQRPLRVTFQAMADMLASAANYTMGEGGQGRPFAIARDEIKSTPYTSRARHSMSVDPAECIFLRSLGSN